MPKSPRLLLIACALAGALNAAPARAEERLTLKGRRFLTLNTVIRVNQIESARDLNVGADEAAIHTPETVAAFRAAVSEGFPGAKVTWAFSWLALRDARPNYAAIRKLVAGYHAAFGDEITFIPGGYFAPMYSPRAQVNRDIQEALQQVRDMVGGGYKPKSIVAGFLSAENLRYLAEEEGIHVCQGTIWSQYGIDNGDGDGSISYPYYPSREHACKPAQGRADFIDCVNLDGWTCDFLCARRFGFEGGFNSRLGVGPIESYHNLGVEKGMAEAMAVTANHFDDGFRRNGFGWVTNCWEISLVKSLRPDVLGCLGSWLSNVRKRWPDTLMVTQGEFGEAWRGEHPDNRGLDYRFVQRGTGIGGSEPNLEIRWFMNADFRLAILRDWQKDDPGEVIDFTRYDLTAHEPADPAAGKPSRNWSLINRINQKRRRPEDAPVPLSALTDEERALIRKHYPELFPAGKETARVTAIWGGAREAIALRSDGTVWTWGHNGAGQLGIGNTDYQPIPVQVLGPGGHGPLSSVVAIAGGEAHNVAVTSDGRVWTWGQQSNGQKSSFPVRVAGLDSVVAVASRAYHTLAVKSDGSVWAWGMNTNGGLGTGDAKPVNAPARVQGLNNPIMVSAGYCYSLALLQDHTVVAWGKSKQLGTGSKTDSYAPVAVSGLTDIVWISAGWTHALAVKSDGTVWTWGENYWGGAYKGYGKLGNGTTSDQPVPAPVPDLTDVVRASGGDDFSAVLKSDGTVWTFGANGAGQLGNGDPGLAPQLSPVRVVGLKDVIYIVARDFHAQAIQSDGTVWSWGSGAQGELGVPCKPLTVSQQFELTGAGDRNPPPPNCTNSNIPVRVKWR